MLQSRWESALSPFGFEHSGFGGLSIRKSVESCGRWNNQNASISSEFDQMDGDRLTQTGHALQFEPGYDYVKEIARGGYGYVYLFVRIQSGGKDYVAGKFIYRHLFGPSDEGSSVTAYERALEG